MVKKWKCPLCKNEIKIVKKLGVAVTFNGLCKNCAKATYLVWRDLTDTSGNQPK